MDIKSKQIVAEGSWADVQAKGYDLYASNSYTVEQADPNHIKGTVAGDHDIYDCEIWGTNGLLSYSECSCPWGKYMWDRETHTGRNCSHLECLDTAWKTMTRYNDFPKAASKKKARKAKEGDRFKVIRDFEDNGRLVEYGETGVLTRPVDRESDMTRPIYVWYGKLDKDGVEVLVYNYYIVLLPSKSGANEPFSGTSQSDWFPIQGDIVATVRYSYLKDAETGERIGIAKGTQLRVLSVGLGEIMDSASLLAHDEATGLEGWITVGDIEPTIPWNDDLSWRNKTYFAKKASLQVGEKVKPVSVDNSPGWNPNIIGRTGVVLACEPDMNAECPYIVHFYGNQFTEGWFSEKDLEKTSSKKASFTIGDRVTVKTGMPIRNTEDGPCGYVESGAVGVVEKIDSALGGIAYVRFEEGADWLYDISLEKIGKKQADYPLKAGDKVKPKPGSFEDRAGNTEGTVIWEMFDQDFNLVCVEWQNGEMILDRPDELVVVSNKKQSALNVGDRVKMNDPDNQDMVGKIVKIKQGYVPHGDYYVVKWENDDFVMSHQAGELTKISSKKQSAFQVGDKVVITENNNTLSTPFIYGDRGTITAILPPDDDFGIGEELYRVEGEGGYDHSLFGQNQLQYAFDKVESKNQTGGRKTGGKMKKKDAGITITDSNGRPISLNDRVKVVSDLLWANGNGVNMRAGATGVVTRLNDLYTSGGAVWVEFAPDQYGYSGNPNWQEDGANKPFTFSVDGDNLKVVSSVNANHKAFHEAVRYLKDNNHPDHMVKYCAKDGSWGVCNHKTGEDIKKFAYSNIRISSNGYKHQDANGDLLKVGDRVTDGLVYGTITELVSDDEAGKIDGNVCYTVASYVAGVPDEIKLSTPHGETAWDSVLSKVSGKTLTEWLGNQDKKAFTKFALDILCLSEEEMYHNPVEASEWQEIENEWRRYVNENAGIENLFV